MLNFSINHRTFNKEQEAWKVQENCQNFPSKITNNILSNFSFWKGIKLIPTKKRIEIRFSGLFMTLKIFQQLPRSPLHIARHCRTVMYAMCTVVMRLKRKNQYIRLCLGLNTVCRPVNMRTVVNMQILPYGPDSALRTPQSIQACMFSFY